MLDHLGQIVLLMGVALAVVSTFRRLHIPTSLGYLLVGVLLGPHTTGPGIDMPQFRVLAEFGVVFLLFTIGLNFSLPRLRALRHQVLWLGTGQVIITTAAIGLVLWIAGLSAPAAFVFGAVFAQSSTTIIGAQLAEQSEENAHHGRFGLAMSVFQDVTAVPFLVIIPVLGITAGAEFLLGELAWTSAKAAAAVLLLLVVGRWLLGPLFHVIAERRSGEVFTLAVLTVALLAAWTTSYLGLSLAFGGFIAGMVLGETAFRHQVESSIRPFRDVLLGMFFIGIGMLFDPLALPPIWHWVVVGALLSLAAKTLIVAALLRLTGAEPITAWRTGMLLAVGGEFGLALIAIALDAQVIGATLGQIALSAVLVSMVAGALLIRFNASLASVILGAPGSTHAAAPGELEPLEQTVVLGGYGRVGHAVAALLQACDVPFIAFDNDHQRVRLGRSEGHPVHYGDVSDAELLAAIHIERASALIITVDRADTGQRVLDYVHSHCPQVPVIARARDLETSTRFLRAGALRAYPETVEASLLLGEAALRELNVPDQQIDRVLQAIRDRGYRPVVVTGDQD
jgi:monovalent cation:H+ antiporter-2, CPA2 family